MGGGGILWGCRPPSSSSPLSKNAQQIKPPNLPISCLKCRQTFFFHEKVHLLLSRREIVRSLRSPQRFVLVVFFSRGIYTKVKWAIFFHFRRCHQCFPPPSFSIGSPPHSLLPQFHFLQFPSSPLLPPWKRTLELGLPDNQVHPRLCFPPVAFCFSSFCGGKHWWLRSGPSGLWKICPISLTRHSSDAGDWERGERGRGEKAIALLLSFSPFLSRHVASRAGGKKEEPQWNPQIPFFSLSLSCGCGSRGRRLEVGMPWSLFVPTEERDPNTFF